MQKQKRPHRILRGVIIALLAIAGFWAWGNNFSQKTLDFYVVSQFKPSEEIAEMVDRSGMNERGKFVFYAAKPQLNDAEEFNTHCGSLMNAESNVLGCYDGMIYIFNVTDERIADIKTVTGAHEMLHAAYTRLPFWEKTRVDKLIQAEIDTTTNQEMLDLLESYRLNEPGQELNEMHSILATEEANLSAELDEYYQKYFGDRQKTVALYHGYKAVFEELEQQAKGIEARLKDLENEIKTLEAQFNNENGALSADIDRFNACAERSDCFSASEFSAQRQRLLARQSAQTAKAKMINLKIDEYNGLVEQMRAIGRNIEGLQSSLSSQAAIE